MKAIALSKLNTVGVKNTADCKLVRYRQLQGHGTAMPLPAYLIYRKYAVIVGTVLKVKRSHLIFKTAATSKNYESSYPNFKRECDRL